MSREADEKERREKKLAIEPTIPATDVRSGVPDFSSERRPAEGAPGGATLWVIVALVVGVGVLFWWLGGAKQAAAPTPTPTPTAAPTSVPASAPKAPPPKAAPQKAPATTPPAAKSPPPPVAAPAPATADATAPPTHKRAAHKRHKKPAATAKHKEVKLPRLPSPPPAD